MRELIITHLIKEVLTTDLIANNYIYIHVCVCVLYVLYVLLVVVKP